MHPQLQLVADEYRSAQARLHDLVRAVPDEQWGKRSDPARWSVVECVAHLNITDRKSTRLNSSHSQISYAVFCLKKKKNISMSSYQSHNNSLPTTIHPRPSAPLYPPYWCAASSIILLLADSYRSSAHSTLHYAVA